MILEIEGINERFKPSILEGIEIARQLLPHASRLVSKLSVGYTEINGSHYSQNGNPYYGTCRLVIEPKPHYEIILDKNTLQQEYIHDEPFGDDLQIKRWVVHEFCHAAEMLFLFNRRPIYGPLVIGLKLNNKMTEAAGNLCGDYYLRRLSKNEKELLRPIFDSKEAVIEEMMPDVFEKYVFFHCGMLLRVEVKDSVELVDRIVSDYQQLLLPKNEKVLSRFFLYDEE